MEYQNHDRVEMISTVADRKTACIKRKRLKIFLTYILNNDKLYL